MDIKIQMLPCVNCQDINKLIGTYWNNCEFAQTQENDSYANICLSDWRLKTLREELDDEMRKLGITTTNDIPNSRHYYAYRLWNEIRLVEAFRQMGYQDTMLVAISW